MNSMNILILCTGNTCRSPMAEGILLTLLTQHNMRKITVKSRGFAAQDGDPPTTYAISVMEESGIDISAKRSQRVTYEDLQQVDALYVMTVSHQNILLETMPELRNKIKILEIAAPYMREMRVYRACRDQMQLFFADEIQKWKVQTDAF